MHYILFLLLICMSQDTPVNLTSVVTLTSIVTVTNVVTLRSIETDKCCVTVTSVVILASVVSDEWCDCYERGDSNECFSCHDHV